MKACRIADLEELHSGLMSLVDVLLCGASDRIQLHAIRCPCIAHHEATLLNAWLISKTAIGEAEHYPDGLLCPVACRLVIPLLCSVVNALDIRGMRLEHVPGLEQFAPLSRGELTRRVTAEASMSWTGNGRSSARVSSVLSSTQAAAVSAVTIGGACAIPQSNQAERLATGKTESTAKSKPELIT